MMSRGLVGLGNYASSQRDASSGSKFEGIGGVVQHHLLESCEIAAKVARERRCFDGEIEPLVLGPLFKHGAMLPINGRVGNTKAKIPMGQQFLRMNVCSSSPWVLKGVGEPDGDPWQNSVLRRIVE